MAPRKQPLSELSHVPSQPSSGPSDPWPTSHDVWFDHTAAMVVVRKSLDVPRPVRAARFS